MEDTILEKPRIRTNVMRKKSISNERFKQVLESFKSLDLKLYVVRRAHAKCYQDSENLIEAEDKILTEQEDLIQKLGQHKLESTSDVLKVLEVWYLNKICNQEKKALSPSDKLILNVFNYLKWKSS